MLSVSALLLQQIVLSVSQDVGSTPSDVHERLKFAVMIGHDTDHICLADHRPDNSSRSENRGLDCLLYDSCSEWQNHPITQNRI
jgi:hypothetical protein